MKKNILLLSIALCVFSFIYGQNNKLDNEILNLENNSSITAEETFKSLSDYSRYSAIEQDTFNLFYNQINDTLKAPYLIYIPPKYDFHKKTALIVYLHGGVSRADFVEEPLTVFRDNPFIPFAEKNNWLMLFPLGKMDYTWWDYAGIQNVKEQIIHVKKNFNVDDDRIFITGFSDGGSGSFYWDLTNPDDFASFFPLNGFMSVGGLVTQTPVFLENMMNRPCFAINTDLDQLYPSKRMKPLMELAISAGADILYKEYFGIGHAFDYAEQEVPIIIQNMKNNPREIFRPKIYWETWTPEFGKCDWIEIVSLDTLQSKKEWQKEYLKKLPDDRISFGFYMDREFEGDGIRVNKVMDTECTAKEMGLEDDDIIIKMDGKSTLQNDDMAKIKQGKARGDSVSLIVLREGIEILLKGKFPEITYSDAFIYNKPSGAVKAQYCGNEFSIQTSCVKEVAIYLHPDMVNFENPIKVIINDEEIYNQKVEPDKEFILENFRENYDRTALWCKKLVFEIE